MPNVNPSDLATFLAIARHKSFRRAADELGVTPSALSHKLRALEERLDLRLVNRTTRSVAVTEAGEQLFARVAPAFRSEARRGGKECGRPRRARWSPCHSKKKTNKM